MEKKMLECLDSIGRLKKYDFFFLFPEWSNFSKQQRAAIRQ